MTAVVAYVEANLAFIAADTKRSRALAPASKVHAWSDSILIGQAGCATYMTKAIDCMMKCRNATGDGFASALNGFLACRGMFHAEAVSALGAADSDGTLLIACSNPADGGPSLWTIALDPSKPEQRVSSDVTGIGDPRTAAAAAAGWSSSARHLPSGLPSWGTSVIGSLIGSHIDWPIDLLIARQSVAPGERVVVRQRLADDSAAYDPAFG